MIGVAGTMIEVTVESTRGLGAQMYALLQLLVQAQLLTIIYSEGVATANEIAKAIDGGTVL